RESPASSDATQVPSPPPRPAHLIRPRAHARVLRPRQNLRPPPERERIRRMYSDALATLAVPPAETAPGQPAASVTAPSVEVSVVMPCLNEADTVASCVRKAKAALQESGIPGAVGVADTGTTAGWRPLAEAAGARVVPVADRGYGCALMGGIAAARGRFVVMGDADDSYDFGAVPAFVAKLREGYELVQGC